MKRFFLIAILSMVLVNCNNDDNGEQSFVPQNIIPILIAQNDLGGFNIPNWNSYNNYFNNEDDWNLFLEWSLPNSPSIPTIFTNIDFNTYSVIVCIDYPRPSNGFSIGFNSVIEHENEIIVSINYIDNGGVSAQPSRPFIIAKIPKTTKPIVFE